MSKKALLQFVSAVVLPLLAFGFVIADRCGALDWCFGHDAVLEVALRLETSYEPGVDRQVGPDERAWKPLLRLIKRYSTARLPRDKEPKMLARFVAVASGKIDTGAGPLAEWTAPSTPIVLIYREWPGQEVPLEDAPIVGSIGDIRGWVDHSRTDFRFLVQDIILALFSLALGAILWTAEFPNKRNSLTERFDRQVRGGQHDA